MTQKEAAQYELVKEKDRERKEDKVRAAVFRAVVAEATKAPEGGSADGVPQEKFDRDYMIDADQDEVA